MLTEDTEDMAGAQMESAAKTCDAQMWPEMDSVHKLSREPRDNNASEERAKSDVTRREDRQNGDTQSSVSEQQRYDIGLLQYQATDSKDDDRHPDYSTLPKLVWVMILSMLEQDDKQAVAMTCKTLYDLCETESILWRSARLQLGTETDARGDDCQIKLTPTEISVLSAHKHQIQNLEIVINDLNDSVFNEQTFRILNEASKTWSLKSLDINCRALTGNDQFFCGDPVLDNVGKLILNCLTPEKADKLEHLRILHFSLASGDENPIILDALKVCSFNNSLKTLVFDPVCEDEMLGDTNTVLVLNECLQRLENLQELSLSIEFLSNRLLETLTHCSQLQILLFFCNYEIYNKIDIKKWTQLLKCLPRLSVRIVLDDFEICDHIPAMFPPTVPITHVTVASLSNFGPEADDETELLKLLPAYSRSLVSIVWEDDVESEIDSVLINTVKQCPNLMSLFFEGRIKSSSVITLASMRQWKHLRFCENSIIFPEFSTETRAWQMSKLRKALRKRLGHRFSLYNDDECYGLLQPFSFQIVPEPVQR